MYYKARYYDPALGRFITADSVIPGADKTQAYNRYMYVAGNPVSFNDPDGHGFKKWVKKIETTSLGFLVGGPIGAYYAYKHYEKIDKAIGKFFHDRVDDVKQYWDDHKWFRITTYILAITAVTLLAYFTFPVFVVIGGYTINTTALGLLIGSGIGFILGGTHGLDNQWDWEGAFKGMLIGGVIGALLGYSIGNDINAVGETHHPFTGTITYGAENTPTEGLALGFNYGTGSSSLSLNSFQYYHVRFVSTKLSRFMLHSFDLISL